MSPIRTFSLLRLIATGPPYSKKHLIKEADSTAYAPYLPYLFSAPHPLLKPHPPHTTFPKFPPHIFNLYAPTLATSTHLFAPFLSNHIPTFGILLTKHTPLTYSYTFLRFCLFTENSNELIIIRRLLIIPLQTKANVK